MEIELLTAENDSERWLKVWEHTGRQPWAHPSYVHQVSGAGASPVAVVGCRPGCGGEVLLPLELRPVECEFPTDPGLLEAVSPYGYGGPYVSVGLADDVPAHAEFFAGYGLWAAANGVVSSFLRYDVLSTISEAFPGSTVVADNIVRPLRLTTDELLAEYDHKVRKNLRKGERTGVSVTIDERGLFADRAKRIYLSTMSRRSARPEYLAFQSLFDALPGRVPCVYAHALLDGVIVASELLLTSDREIYSFLGGTLEEAYPFRANDCLKHGITLWASQAGYHTYVLGGGASPGDGIFRYKRSFSPDGVVPFRTGRIIHLPEAYERLVCQYREDCDGSGEELDEGFFPLYRAPRRPRSRDGVT